MNKNLRIGLALLLTLSLSHISRAQESDEQPSTKVSLGDLNYAEYDKCKGILYLGMPTSDDAVNQHPIYKAYVYIKIGGQWKNMLTIRGEDAHCCNVTASAAMSGGTSWNSTASPAYNEIVNAANHNNGHGVSTNVDNTSGTIESGHVKRRIGYYNGSVNNFSWLSYEDEKICEVYNSTGLNLTSNDIQFVKVPNPPFLNTSHSSGIGTNLTDICIYPTTGNAWGLQFGIKNVPRAAIENGTINIRVYVNYRHYMDDWDDTDAGRNTYKNYEYTVTTNLPEAPQGLTATTNQCGKITLNWVTPTQAWTSNFNCTESQNYRMAIYRDNQFVATVNGDVSTYTDNSASLAPRQTYNYTVKTVLLSSGDFSYRLSGSSNVAVGNMKMPPAQPGPFNASMDNCNTQINLSWSQPTGTAVDKYVFSVPAENFTADLLSSARSYNWTTGVDRGTTYITQLTAYNDCGYPSDVAAVNGLSPADPAKATNVQVTLNAAYDMATVTWADNANNETKYQVLRQDNLGNITSFDVNPNTTSFTDNSFAACRSYTYSIKVFNDCVQSGLVSATSATTPLIPPPNLNTSFTSAKKLTASKGYFTNRVELSWQNNNGQNIDQFRIFRKIDGTTYDSALVGTANAGSGFYVDNTADPRVYYKYTIVGIKYCNGTDMPTNTSEDIGFRNPVGNVSGHIEYNGGIALKGAKVIIQQSGTISGNSLKFAPGGTLTMSSPSMLNLNNQLRIEFWFKPTSTANQTYVEKAGVFSFKRSGSNYIALVNVGGTDYTVSVPESKFAQNQWKHVSIQYSGAAGKLKLYGNGVSLQTTDVPDETVSNVNNKVVMGDANASFFMDEFRLLALAADSATISMDHARYINASTVGAKISLHFDENYGHYAYDGSSQNNVYNANHFFKNASVSWSLDKPSSGQLSYYGITDNLGNYSVSSIVFSGTGENFTIIPSYLTHSFTPNSRSVYMGDASTVFNNQDFTDNSSFTITGDLFYGESLAERYCAVPDAVLKIDGNAVLAYGQQVKTDAQGNFTLEVPIGKHYLEVELYGHTMAVGRFPATGVYDFQDDKAGIHFVDSTKRIIVGRVVGGLIEADKLPGLGKSKNNIGRAKIKIASPIAGVACYSKEVTTNATTGEYRFNVYPLQYKVESVALVTDPFKLNVNNTTNTNVVIDLRNMANATTVRDTLRNANGQYILPLQIDSAKYHKRLDMIYRVAPTVNVVAATTTAENAGKFIGETSLGTAPNIISLTPDATHPWGIMNYPVFKQDKQYEARIKAEEVYTNIDNNAIDRVRLSGKARIYNDMVSGDDSNAEVTITNGEGVYKFKCGAPNTTVDNSPTRGTKTLQIDITPTSASTIHWEPNGTGNGTVYRAYVFGKRTTGASATTLGPEMVDYILRDPPGSGSSATWEAGTTLTTSTTSTFKHPVGGTWKDMAVIGVKKILGIGVAEVADNYVAIGGAREETTSHDSTGVTITSSKTLTTISTRSDAGNVGASADLFIGKSQNWIDGLTLGVDLVDATSCSTMGDACFGPVVQGKRLAVIPGFASAPEKIATTFAYTQSEIETVVIPKLEYRRNLFLTGQNPRYHSVLASTNEWFGSNNDDPHWARPNNDPSVYDKQDTTGSSYTFKGYTKGKTDSVRLLNNQIALWKRALARNEREKIDAVTRATGYQLQDNFTLGSAILTKSYSTDKSRERIETTEHFLKESFVTEMQVLFSNLGVKGENCYTNETTTTTDQSTTTVNTSSFTYTLTDGDAGDILSIDVYGTSTGNVFITRGGQTMCPYEGEVVSHYYDPQNADAFIGSHTYKATGFGNPIQKATQKREEPHIEITPINQVGIPSNQAAVYQLKLRNDAITDFPNDVQMRVFVASQSNPNGAVVKIDGLDPNTLYTIPKGASLTKTLTVERGPVEINYDNLMIIFASACSDALADTVKISAHFIPTCTELKLTAPNDNWVFNNSINNSANIVVSDYNYNYSAATDNSTTPPTKLGFNKIGLEVRSSSSNAWTEYSAFYKYPTSGQRAIPTNQIYSQYSWDISSIPDGAYELKAKSYCLNKDGSYSTVESPIHKGVMDRINPTPFGTPSPADGILDPNDDISIKFNETIDIGALSSRNFDVRGVLNGGNSRQSESLSFDGVDDYAEVTSGANLQKRSFTFEFWAKLNGTGVNQTVISQGTDATQSLAIGFDAGNKFAFSMGAQSSYSVNAVPSPTQWHHYAAVYDYSSQTVSLYADGVLVNSGNTSLLSDYNGQGKLVFGKQLPSNTNYFNGNLNDLRLWSKTRTNGEIVRDFNKDLSNTSSGLLYNWKMNEAEGSFTHDVIRSRDAQLQGAAWQVTPNGYAAQLDGVDDRIDINSSTISITPEMDFTLEFWFKSNQSGVATLFSNGSGNAGVTDSFTWNIQKDASGIIHVFHNNYDFVATDKNYFDNQWHHFALVLQRTANISCYIDGSLQKSLQANSFKQVGGPYIYLGAKGSRSGNVVSYSNHFNGSIDEFRFWNTSRKVEQIKRDKQNRLKGDEYGLIAFVPFESYAIDPTGIAILASSFKEYSTETTSVPTDSVFVRNGAVTTSQTPAIKLPRPIQSINFETTVNNDQIIITPLTSPELIENVTLDVTVKEVYDLRGNKMASPKTWIAYINKNQVLWQEVEKSFVKKSEEVITFTMNVVNNGGALKEYNIGGLPSWMTANKTSGSISPNSLQAITFTIPAGTPVGEYDADLTLTTDFGYAEVLRIHLKVTGVEPVWIVNTSDFQYSMGIIGEIKIDGVIATNTSTKIGAFINNTLSGVATLKYMSAYDRYEVFLNVYHNKITGDSIRFQVYDATTGTTFVNVSPAIMFEENNLVGNVNTPVTFTANSEVSLNIPLKAGWTWISLPLRSKQLQQSNLLMAEVTNADNDIVRTIDTYDQYSSASGWIGTISSSTERFQNSKMYQIKKASSGTLVFTGTRIHPDETTAAINVVPGWNWIGFVSVKNADVNAAMSGYTAATGDILKSQFEFAFYDSNTGWVGSLTTLRPGLGYMLKSTANSSFHYPASVFYGNTMNGRTTSTMNTEGDDVTKMKYILNAESYEKTMSVIVRSNLCDQFKTNNVVLAAFDNQNNLRGHARPLYTSSAKDYLYYLTVYGNTTDETLQLKYINLADGAEVSSDTRIDFVPDALMGSLVKPLQANVASTATCFNFTDKVTIDDVRVSPNPFNKTLNIVFGKEVNVVITLTDVLGKVYTVTKSEGKSSVIIDVSELNLPDGVYLLRLLGDVQKTMKVIKSGK